jgi:hypothetical protein
MENYIAFFNKKKVKRIALCGRDYDTFNYWVYFVDTIKGKILTSYNKDCKPNDDFIIRDYDRKESLWFYDVDISIRNIWYEIELQELKSNVLFNLIKSGKEHKIKLAMNIIKSNGKEFKNKN